ncbi:MAG: glycosyltransferase family 4 protein [Euryarchaeota archaeon]|nr:glycosyltransferase family 4 protein [Euryarchaeota archaeon]
MGSKIAIIQNDISKKGGAEYTARVAIEALNEIGIVPDVYAFNSDNSGLKYNFCPLIGPKRFLGMYRGFLKNLQIYKLKGKYDTILDFSGIIANIDSDQYIYYVHFPEYAIKEYNKKYSSTIGSIYWLPRTILLDRLQKQKYLKNKNINLYCNSEFTKKILHDTTDKDIPVLYPPVEVEKLINDKRNRKSFSNRDGIVTLGRFSDEKKQLEQLEIARNFPKIHFYICGSVPRWASYYKSVMKYKNKHNLENVHLKVNIGTGELRNIMYATKFFMHNMRYEQFGISLIEGIACGNIPLAHKSGNADILINDNFLKFNNVEEAVKIIENYYENDKLLDKLRKKYLSKIILFDKKNFMRKIQEIVSNDFS